MKTSLKEHSSSDTGDESTGDFEIQHPKHGSHQFVFPGKPIRCFGIYFNNQEYIVTALPFHAACCVAIFLGAVCYLNSLNGAFVFDDAEAIVNNEDVKGNNALSQVFYNDFWGTSLTHKSSHKSYRPLTTLSFR